jgi:mono/diheme cytochrome c family protein
MRNFIFGVLFTLLVSAAGIVGYLALGFSEVRGDLPPSGFEKALMSRAVHVSVRREAPKTTNPFSPTDENLIAGGKVYLGECSGCHGTPGKTQEHPEASYPPAPDFPTAGTQYSEAEVFWIAKHGVRRTAMFANGVWDSDEKLWKAAAFIKRMKSLPSAVTAALVEKKTS